ncbi:Uncharacterised protein [Mycobacteroides abscessus subsp. massiliense]|nr:Uncharacterised protein [Mycobacteroides abscessus subsp. massiliense]
MRSQTRLTELRMLSVSARASLGDIAVTETADIMRPWRQSRAEER